MDDPTLAAGKPVEAEEEEVTLNPLGQPVKYVDDEQRRAAEVHLSEEEAAKYVVQEATPSSGGVFPPSAVVTPFSPEDVAAHTPGDEGRTKALEAQTTTEEKPVQPAANTTPAKKT